MENEGYVVIDMNNMTTEKFAILMREAQSKVDIDIDELTCWQPVKNGTENCMLKLGHDNGVHENES